MKHLCVIPVAHKCFFLSYLGNCETIYITVSDERYFRLAESYLYAELGFALNKEKDEVCRLIIDSVKNGNI